METRTATSFAEAAPPSAGTPGENSCRRGGVGAGPNERSAPAGGAQGAITARENTVARCSGAEAAEKWCSASSRDGPLRKCACPEGGSLPVPRR